MSKATKAAKETLLGTIFSYLGIFLGAFYTIFIIPNLFHEYPENYGTLLFLMNYVGLFVIFSSMATPLSLIRFYPVYKKEKREKMLSFLFWINILGIGISAIVFYLYSSGHPIELNVEGKQINISYFFYPLLVSMTFFSLFQSYCNVLLKISAPIFLNNTFMRFWFFLILLLYYYDLISLMTFTYLYFGQYIISFLALLVFVAKIKKDTFSLRFCIPENYKEIIRYSLFALPAASATVLIAKVDIQMIGNFLGDAQVTYYSYALFFMSVLLTPKNSLTQTSRSIISRDFQTQSIETFTPKYFKISFAFLLATLIVFVGIVINIEELMQILGNKFGNNDVKYAILILGLGRVLESVFVSNHYVLEYSKHYKMMFVFEVVSLILLVLLNFFMIPAYGIVGAALSSAIIFMVNAALKSTFVYKKMQLLPIRYSDIKTVVCIALLGLLYFIPFGKMSLFSEDVMNTLAIIVVRSIIFVIFLLVMVEMLGLRKLYLNFLKKQ